METQNKGMVVIRLRPDDTRGVESLWIYLIFASFVPAKTWCLLQNRKYITHCTVGHNQHAQKFWRVWISGLLRYASRQTSYTDMLVAILRTPTL